MVKEILSDLHKKSATNLLAQFNLPSILRRLPQQQPSPSCLCSSPFEGERLDLNLDLGPMYPPPRLDRSRSLHLNQPLRNENTVLHASVGARLHLFWEEWSCRGAEPWLVQVLREGCSIPFQEKPPLSKSPINLAAYLAHPKQLVPLSQEVESLLHKGTVEEILDPNLRDFTTVSSWSSSHGGTGDQFWISAP